MGNCRRKRSKTRLKRLKSLLLSPAGIACVLLALAIFLPEQAHASLEEFLGKGNTLVENKVQPLLITCGVAACSAVALWTGCLSRALKGLMVAVIVSAIFYMAKNGFKLFI